jgi:hypothetical protein
MRRKEIKTKANVCASEIYLSINDVTFSLQVIKVFLFLFLIIFFFFFNKTMGVSLLTYVITFFIFICNYALTLCALIFPKWFNKNNIKS